MISSQSDEIRKKYFPELRRLSGDLLSQVTEKLKKPNIVEAAKRLLIVVDNCFLEPLETTGIDSHKLLEKIERKIGGDGELMAVLKAATGLTKEVDSFEIEKELVLGLLKNVVEGNWGATFNQEISAKESKHQAHFVKHDFGSESDPLPTCSNKQWSTNISDLFEHPGPFSGIQLPTTSHTYAAALEDIQNKKVARKNSSAAL
eukprot:Gregarina_sp_Poly_1__519@NODE_1126_length_5010_cov_45_168521_g690_i2_p1_GENE_NODE_1126_length_5010_cov_45_168521_g690_i2NODE_1126_length_5010_cov_45_168521_g690_i2_p1_ORF_typecomplete_len203_score40_56_NODE_1126_length_5010_cov_45_168521_g690_i223542962